MSNTFYPKGAQKILRAQINFGTDTIKAVLVPTAYTFSAAHEFLSDVGATVGTAQTLANKTTDGGVFDADDPDFGALAAGSTVKGLVLYKDSGSAATSPLVCYLDEVIGFPFPTNGGVVKVPWSDGVAKILSLM